MAMKVITPGVLPLPVKYMGTCRHCKAVVECDEQDVKHQPVSAAGDTEPRRKCPTAGCGRFITLQRHVVRERT